MQNQKNNKLITHLEYFYHWEKTTPDAIFLSQPSGNSWYNLTYKQAGEEIRKMTSALYDLGLKKGDHIGILSKNCYHWILCDLAIGIGGFISIPYYASLPKTQLEEVINKSDIKLLFVGKLDTWDNKSEAISKDVKVIKFPHYEGNAEIPLGIEWNALISDSNIYKENYIPKIDELWTILFTSGTTGSPKGVMLSYKASAVVFDDEKKYNSLGIYDLKKHSFLSFLPLNHVAERVVIEGAAIFTGGKISFAESIDTFINNLQDVQPTIFFAVPRIWSKFQSGVFTKIPQKKLDTLLKIPLLNSYIKKKLKKGLGLSNAEIVLTGAALTPNHLKQWYRKLGINLREVFGMTESCGAITLTPINDFSENNVGKALPCTEIRIDSETGEILYKTEQIMLGYYKEPDKTKEILKDGWLYSGDKGAIDSQNHLQVIGRVADAFKTDKGKYIVPNPIESMLLKFDIIEQCCVVGLGISQPIGLINLSELSEGLSKDNIENKLTQILDKINTKLSNYEKLSTIVIILELWTEQNNLLTPTLKVKRNILDENNMSQYPEWHKNDSKIIWHK